MRSFVLLENVADKTRNRIIIYSFLCFTIVLSVVIYYGVLFGLNSLNFIYGSSASVDEIAVLNFNKTEVVCGAYHFNSYIADTDKTMREGLSIFDNLNKKDAMLFVFNEESSHSIWMKNMKFSIDILWIDNGGKIVHMEENISPNTYPKNFVNTSPALYVLEIQSGMAQESKIKIGDYCNFKF